MGITVKQIKDAGECFSDRYIVEFSNGEIFNLSHDADAPNGCCIYVGNTSEEQETGGSLYIGGSSGDGKNTILPADNHIQICDLPLGTQRQVERILRDFDSPVEEADTIDPQWVEMAKEEYGSDVISFDDKPAIAVAGDNNGAWVAAWVWVAAE